MKTVLIFIILALPVSVFGNAADTSKLFSKLILVIKNSPKQELKVQAVKGDGNYFIIDTVLLGTKAVDSLSFIIPVAQSLKEQSLNLVFTKRGPGFVLPVLQPGETLKIITDLLLPGVLLHTSFTGSPRTKELFDFGKNGNELSKVYLLQKDKYLNSVIQNKPDSVRQKKVMDSLNQERINYERQAALSTNSPAILNFILSGTTVYGYTFADSEYDLLKKKFWYDNYTQKQLNFYQKSNRFLLGLSPFSGTLINTHMLNFTFPDLNGQPISLAKYKGKYILVDLWASWCAPCREESPFIKEALSRFRKDNFIVLSVSIDKDKESWRNAIKNDKTEDFVHLIDDKGWQADLIKYYKINGIPANFLLDPNGLIIAKDLRGKELIVKLINLFKQNN